MPTLSKVPSSARLSRFSRSFLTSPHCCRKLVALILLLTLLAALASFLLPSLSRTRALSSISRRTLFRGSSTGGGGDSSGRWQGSAICRESLTGEESAALGLSEQRPTVLGFVGVNTGFGSAGRRQALRETWFPKSKEAHARLQEGTGLIFRFVIGRTKDEKKEAELQEEIKKYDDFIRLDVEEAYLDLNKKTLAYFKTVFRLFDAEFYVKADDDVYLRPDRLGVLLAKDRKTPLTYLGCMKKGDVITDKKYKWYEPQGFLLGKEYFLHAYGPIYALSNEVVKTIMALPEKSLRFFINEDVTIGSWMLALNVNHESDFALCSKTCTATSIAVWDIPKCSGLCKPVEKMPELHADPNCRDSPTLAEDNDSKPKR